MSPQFTFDYSGRSVHGRIRNCLTPFPVSVECLASTVGTCSSSGHLLGTSLSVRVLPMETGHQHQGRVIFSLTIMFGHCRKKVMNNGENQYTCFSCDHSMCLTCVKETAIYKETKVPRLPDRREMVRPVTWPTTNKVWKPF